MRERPIIFSSEMVGAIRAGRKTQTRRVMKPQPHAGADAKSFIYDPNGKRRCLALGWRRDENDMCEAAFCRYGNPGDRLWVREKFSISGNGYFYGTDSDGSVKVAWSSPIHMPRKASRITLEITNIRVERLQNIKALDIAAEGIEFDKHYPVENSGSLTPCDEARAFNSFQSGWNKLNAKRGFSFEKNPWVWVIEFKMIDQEKISKIT